MLKRLTPREQIEILTSEWEPRYRSAFLEAVAEIVSRITLRLLVERLERGDVQGAIDALTIERAAFGSLANIVPQALNAGGVAIVGNLPRIKDPEGNRAVLRFDLRDPAAEAWAREHSATLVQGLTDEAQATARQTIDAGLSQGRGPRAIATDLAGRVNRVTGRRTGGVLGLTRQQAAAVAKARSELISGDLAGYLARGPRDKQFDAMAKRAATVGWAQVAAEHSKRTGKPVTADALIERVTGRYSDKLLVVRANAIARTETMEAMETAQHEAYRQTVDRLGLDPVTDVEKGWRATSGDRTRDTHMALHGQVVTGLDTPFLSFSGAQMRYPGDRSLGAPASEIVQCRCHPNYRLRFDRAVR